MGLRQSATPEIAEETAATANVSSATLRAALNEPTAVLAFADAKGVLAFACCGRMCQTAASSPALWTKLAANRWPCTASGPLAGVAEFAIGPAGGVTWVVVNVRLGPRL